MARFANSTEGEIFQETYCSRCVHDKNSDCPVWLAHLLHNYDTDPQVRSILDNLIPMADDVRVGECALFVEMTEGV